jgi:hypothetical protein
VFQVQTLWRRCILPFAGYLVHGLQKMPFAGYLIHGLFSMGSSVCLKATLAQEIHACTTFIPKGFSWSVFKSVTFHCNTSRIEKGKFAEAIIIKSILKKIIIKDYFSDFKNAF